MNKFEKQVSARLNTIEHALIVVLVLLVLALLSGCATTEQPITVDPNLTSIIDSGVNTNIKEATTAEQLPNGEIILK